VWWDQTNDTGGSQMGTKPLDCSLDRHRGCLLGLAAGDALGTTLEFRAPGTFTPIAGIEGGGPFDLKPGEWTDDTAMALCLAESLVECRGFNAADQMDRYRRWWREGHLSVTEACFDIGTTTRAALMHYERLGDPFAGTTDPRAAGNGCIMRLAPVPMAFAGEPALAIALAADSARTTHGARTCLDASRYLAGLLVGALNGIDKATLLAPRYSPVPGLWAREPLCPEIDAVAAGSFKVKEPPQIRGSGYVVEALEAALWALHSTADFASGALAAVNLGDDADTTGAIYGQLAGACYGLAGIPTQWQGVIAQTGLILGFADSLYELGRGPRSPA
jgi:ADP-ribosyl-[dinitrogen reductase] hydrolase